MSPYEPKLKTEDAKNIWKRLLRSDVIFKGESLHGISHLREPYFPVEFLKNDAARFYKNPKAHRTFLSSGTSSDQRSRSIFSEDGLELYKASAIRSFLPVYESFFGSQKRKCISLIPPVSEWQDSSLAQMVAWFGEQFELSYVSSKEELQSELGDEPVWIFATGFHLVNFYDDNNRITLPKGSIVIETGGTKGRSRSVDRDELYDMISQMFAVPRNYIVSEYSMSELASQSWDYISESKRDGEEVPLEARRFSFPSWVQCKVLSNDAQHEGEGYGALILNDPLRLDFPQPFRIQDMVELESDGSFKLITRMPGAALKGCSLNVENEHLDARLKHKRPVVEGPDDLLLLEEKISEVFRFFIPFLKSSEFLQALALEMEDKLIAEQVRDDLLSGLSLTPAELENLIRALKQRQRKKNWLIILSATHSQQGIFPILLGYLLGLKLTVRKTKRRAGDVEQLILRQFENLKHNSIKTADHSFRINDKTTTEKFDAIMLFSNDETAAAIDQVVDIPVQSFSSVVCGCIFRDKDDLSLLLKDIMSLATRGCMSAKVVKSKVLDLATDILEASEPYEALRDRSAVEAFRMQLELRGVSYKMNDRLLVVMLENKAQYEELILEAPYRVIFLMDESIDVKLDLVGASDVSLGELNAPKFDGKHFSQFYFEV